MRRVRRSPSDDETRRGVTAHGEPHDKASEESIPTEQRGERDEQLDSVTGAGTGLSPTTSARAARGSRLLTPRKELVEVEADDALRMVDKLLEEALGDGERDGQGRESAVPTTGAGQDPLHGEPKQRSVRFLDIFVRG